MILYQPFHNIILNDIVEQKGKIGVGFRSSVSGVQRGGIHSILRRGIVFNFASEVSIWARGSDIDAGGSTRRDGLAEEGRRGQACTA